ncbi:glycosyltransferase family 2 protein [Parasphingorhabdus sp.]|jgi:glycosyltransferase involved in cell wall biosynthesis|uniref:glycosyltransferase family 2 protein n=1 Tax=Parasphingorhabdus sp. TaxID=2709688 RepID=UPI003D2A820B
MDISVVIRTLNEAKWLPELLAAVQAQNLREFTSEVVLVDSGSTDGTLDIAKSFGCEIVTISKADFTFGRSLNVGCDAATGRFLVFISGHCVPVGSDWLYNLCKPLDEGTCVYSYGRQIEREGYSKYSEKQLFLKYFPENSRMPQADFFCNNANSALSKIFWSQYKFDEEVTGLEDMVLAKQLWQDGEKIGYVADAVVEHIHEETWGQVKRRYEREAIALQGIMPEVHVNIGDFLRYTLSGILFDCAAALQERRFWRSALEITMFRTMQYWGTYRGNNEHRKLSRKAKERYFYPR